ncbi:MAG: aldo/keto reductase [Parasporobacterium sp.]|nr:aldo/keto reductase [Parasporobacterium sp.]
MQYRKDKYGNEISVLGFGCMRFTTSGGKIDYDKAKSEIKAALDGGVNYFDTAYIYPGSEALVGQVLEDLKAREQVSITTKLPHYMVKKREDLDRFFNEELSRLRTDHVDYYLIHMLTDADSWKRLCDLGICDWIREKKASGQIRQIGFSYHGGTEMFCRLIDAYDWEFCQIQYNYQDEYAQAGVKGLHYASGKGLPVIIMEPLRGGRLANKLPAEALKLLEEYPVRRTAAAWGFRWLYNQPEVTCILSGMNSLEMVRENLETADSIRPGELTEEEFQIYRDVVNIINRKIKVPCTGCRYCMPCPKGVDIPGCFSAYNNSKSNNLYVGLKEYVMCTVLRTNYSGVSNCIQCGKCEQHCPQGIPIRKELRAIKHRYEFPPLNLVYKLLPKFMKY